VGFGFSEVEFGLFEVLAMKTAFSVVEFGLSKVKAVLSAVELGCLQHWSREQAPGLNCYQ
jgi:hypothetical protein